MFFRDGCAYRGTALTNSSTRRVAHALCAAARLRHCRCRQTSPTTFSHSPGNGADGWKPARFSPDHGVLLAGISSSLRGLRECETERVRRPVRDLWSLLCLFDSCRVVRLATFSPVTTARTVLVALVTWGLRGGVDGELSGKPPLTMTMMRMRQLAPPRLTIITSPEADAIVGARRKRKLANRVRKMSLLSCGLRNCANADWNFPGEFEGRCCLARGVQMPAWPKRISAHVRRITNVEGRLTARN